MTYSQYVYIPNGSALEQNLRNLTIRVQIIGLIQNYNFANFGEITIFGTLSRIKDGTSGRTLGLLFFTVVQIFILIGCIGTCCRKVFRDSSSSGGHLPRWTHIMRTYNLGYILIQANYHGRAGWSGADRYNQMGNLPITSRNLYFISCSWSTYVSIFRRGKRGYSIFSN